MQAINVNQISNLLKPIFAPILSEVVKNVLKEEREKEKQKEPYHYLPEFVNKHEAKKILNVRSHATIDNLVKEGKVKKYKNGHSVRFKKSELMDFYKTWKKYQR